ncbi:hypothetical protein SDC9_128343 [bioreactor metagenome]|uniref:Uncharacterized protein n=1 Tax=bioreactor metagenome TaxID=1076179 RepID=A0A645CWK2_9ZZZZ
MTILPETVTLKSSLKPEQEQELDALAAAVVASM